MVDVAVDTSGFEKGVFGAMGFDVTDSGIFALIDEKKAQKVDPISGEITHKGGYRMAVYRVADNGSVAWKQDLFENASSNHFGGEVNIMAKSDAVHVCAGYSANPTADWGPPPVRSRTSSYVQLVGRFSVSAASGKPLSLALLPNGRGVYMDDCWMTDDATIAFVKRNSSAKPESDSWPKNWSGLVAWDGGGELWRVKGPKPLSGVMQLSESTVASVVYVGEYSLSKETWIDEAFALRQWDMKDGGYKDLAKMHVTDDGGWPKFGQIVPKSDGGFWLTAYCPYETAECALIGSGQSLVTVQSRSSAVIELAPNGGLKTVAACTPGSAVSKCSVKVLGAAGGSTWFSMVTTSEYPGAKPTASFGGVATIGPGHHVFTVAK